MFQILFGSRRSVRRLYTLSLYATFAAFIGVGFGMGPAALLTVISLSALEITFSFDNAIVNAKILGKMSAFWRNIFLTIGIVIAVFGVRLLLPIALVSLTAGLDMLTVTRLAIADPIQYAQRLGATHATIAAFGGMFLLMVFLDFILDNERDVHWLEVIERPMRKIGRLSQVPVIASLILLLAVTLLLGGNEKLPVLLAGLAGIVTNLITHSLTRLIERQRMPGKGKEGEKAGFIYFIYLEVLDASFSFDSVVAAFAITKMVLLIAIGLGVGALWVRSMTMHLVTSNALGKYRYLDHGAHYAIGALAIIMLVSIAYEIPDAVTGLIGAGIVGYALFDSWLYNRQNKLAKA
jgi:uncharacterized protein